MATNPPITIGELSDVPAPGSGVTSQWCQEITRRGVHRFATVAARDAAYPAAAAGVGALCITLDTGTLWTVYPTGPTWVRLSPSAGTVYGVTMFRAALAAGLALTTAQQTVAQVAIPACPPGSLIDVGINAYVNQGTVGTGTAFLSITMGGTVYGPTLVVGDRVQLESYSMRVVNVPGPAAASNLIFQAQKGAAGGAVTLTAPHCTIEAVLYRP